MTDRQPSPADRTSRSQPGTADPQESDVHASSATLDERQWKRGQDRGRGRGREQERGQTTEPTADDAAPLAIEIAGLVKHFGETKAVDGIDLQVPAGGIYGLLGPNGAGKTTVIRMLATLLQPDAGTARVFGDDVSTEGNAVRRRVSLTGQFASVDEDLTGRENLVLLARLLGYSRAGARERASELLDAFGLTEAGTRQVKTYSGGMRRRLDIAASIVVTPELLFLDEPTTGLDPRNRNQVWDIIRALVANGTTVLLTTQYLDEADQLADRIAVIDEGRIIAEGTPGELKASVGSGVLSPDPTGGGTRRVTTRARRAGRTRVRSGGALGSGYGLRSGYAGVRGAVALEYRGERVHARPAESGRVFPDGDGPARTYRGGNCWDRWGCRGCGNCRSTRGWLRRRSQ
ncbi:ATP-binding cassette domain-containing protein [Natrialba hulunbeirensis]|uniref:ATP-binding cassette domain-containing protein n=1 Tax=Natrialba hulunbeirensis TaxID=123783 RepID=UPI000A967342|nr:ATP-binding cassette domain-containing protein [Natrialba hulunbeirensis]